MPEIEFVDPDPEPGEDEQLGTAPRQPRSARTRRAVRLGAAAVLAVVAGSVLVAVLGSHDGGTPGAQRTSVSQPASGDAPPSAPIIGVVTAAGPDVLSVAPPPPSPGPACSTAGLCRTDVLLPPATLDALRAAFPGAVVDGSSSTLTGSSAAGLRLRSRTVRAHLAIETITVDVRPTRAGDTSQVTIGDAINKKGLSVAVVNAHRPWTVVVTVVNPTARAPDITPASTLAADRHLLDP